MPPFDGKDKLSRRGAGIPMHMMQCFGRQYQTNMLNNLWVGSWQTSQDTTQTIFTLDPYGWVRIWKYCIMSKIFVNTIVSWHMSQGSATIGQWIQSFWIRSYNISVYNHTIFVNTFISWRMSQGSVNIRLWIQYLWIWSYDICDYRRKTYRSILIIIFKTIDKQFT